jgi:preprotein translocase subunit SecD
MYKNLRWKFIVTLAVLVVSGMIGVYPLLAARFNLPSPGWLQAYHLKLGLDLKGGVHLQLQVHTDDALRIETDTSGEQFVEALKQAKVAIGAKRSISLTQFAIDGVAPANEQQFRTIADQQLGATFDRDSTGGTYTFTMKPNVAKNRREEAVVQAIQTIERRVNELGVSEPVVSSYGSAGDQIIVELPGFDNVARAKSIISNTAILELKLVEVGPMSDQTALLQQYGGKVPDDMQMLPGMGGDPTVPGSQSFYLVKRVAAITGTDLRSARVTQDDFGKPAVGFTLSNQGSSKFSAVTGANVGRYLAIVLDGRVMSAPVIEGKIDRTDARITGSFTTQEANDLALVLRSGALPASLSYLDQRSVGPTLGQDSIRAGVVASLVGLGLVTLFMLLYYRLAGINAFVSVALNLIILLGFMAYLGAVMTLPGIAGFILTIGMGVDSNVLIFERIREELATRKGVRQALAAGFDRVFITIVDTHVSSLIAAAFLFQFGTGPIRGFATTLFFGLIANVFTAVFVSRTLFEFILSRKPAGATELSI